MRKYFGTDGIRGRANASPITAEMAVRLGQATGQIFKESGLMRPSVVIGKDTRISGYMLESALQAGFTSVGFYCLLVGPMPTPAVAQLTRSLRANVGVMISASHNPYEDNGIKLFSGDGFKLPDDLERRIEELMDNPEKIQLADAASIGKAVRIDDASGRYIAACKASIPRDFKLDGKRIVVDCAHGAAYKIAPKIFWEMGAEVIRIGSDPDGTNINEKCGSTDIAAMQAAVKEYGANLGIALDGDSDRAILCDENGNEIDGDQIMAAIALHMKEKKILKGGAIAATQMSNMGLANFLEENGIGLTRTPVGDRYVTEAMRANGLNFGGEQSGHLVFMDHGTTGDGIVAALQFLYVMSDRNVKASTLGQSFTKYPQVLRNVRLQGALSADQVLDRGAVKAVIEESQTQLGTTGRVFIRKSGTEPLIRVMVEAVDPAHVTAYSERIAKTIEANMS